MFDYHDEEMALIAFGLVFILAILVVQLFYLLTLYRTLSAIRPEFRQVPPGQAWLSFIPLFHLIWPFIINKKVADSIKADLEDRGITESGESSKQFGTLYPSLRVAGVIPAIGPLFSLGYLVVFIIWWTRLGKYKQLLLKTPGLRSHSELLDN